MKQGSAHQRTLFPRRNLFPEGWLLTLLLLPGFLLFSACNNNPYGSFPRGKVFYGAMGDDPRTLDPVRVGDTSSNSIASNIHDTPYQYHYLKRPLKLIPAMAKSMPEYGFRRVNGRFYRTFRFSIKPGLQYQNDACFPGGRGREVVIDDIILSIKRAADASLDPFGMAILAGKIAGFDQYSTLLSSRRKELRALFKQEGRGDTIQDGIDFVRELYAPPLPGVRKLDDYTLELLLTEEFPQVIYFFSLTTGSPTPLECLGRYNGRGGRPSYDRHPVGSGPYLLKEWHSRFRIVLERNPNYRMDDFYPSEGNPEDEGSPLLELAGKQLPLVDRFQFQIIRAGPPVWTLFEQGYLDRAGIPREVFDQVIHNQELSEDYRRKGIRLDRDVDVSTYWWYFNMKDPVVGTNRALRQAVSLALNRKELIERFFNNRGRVAHGLIPPGIEGYSESFVNPYSRYDLEAAKAKLAEAGYPGGIDPATGRPLKLTLTLVSQTGVSSQYRFYIDQLARINVELKINQLDWPTVLEKKQNKTFQMIHGGWHADYPDPQNFLQLFYGPNSSNSYNENSYRNPAFDRLYEIMKNMQPGPRRERIIQRMNEIVAYDTPVVFLFHPLSFGLTHQWVKPLRPHPINTGQLKYRDLDPELRSNKAREWNRPSWWAYGFLAFLLTGIAILILLTLRQYRRMNA